MMRARNKDKVSVRHALKGNSAAKRKLAVRMGVDTFQQIDCRDEVSHQKTNNLCT